MEPEATLPLLAPRGFCATRGMVRPSWCGVVVVQKEMEDLEIAMFTLRRARRVYTHPATAAWLRIAAAVLTPHAKLAFSLSRAASQP